MRIPAVHALALCAALLAAAGCGRTGFLPYGDDPDGGPGAASDGGLPGDEGLAPPPDQAALDDIGAPADFSGVADLPLLPDLAAPDFTVSAAPDLAIVPPDLVPLPDFTALADLAVPPDLLPIPDLAFPPDLASPPDLVPAPDLRPPPDLALPPDLVVVPDLVVCGGTGQPCCGNNTCAGGGCCNGGTCVHDGRACGMAMLCSAGSCKACGAANQPCCENNACTGGGCCTGDKTCVADKSPCGNLCFNGACGTCTMGACIVGGGASCGGAGGACCITPNPLPNFCAVADQVCGNGIPGTCVGCGAVNEPCCDNNSCPGGGCCASNRCVANGGMCGGGACVKGACGGGTCGGLGQPCCAGNPTFCSAPDTVCLSNTCKSCGGKGEPCCFDYAANYAIHCLGPYAPTGIMYNGQFSGTCTCM